MCGPASDKENELKRKESKIRNYQYDLIFLKL